MDLHVFPIPIPPPRLLDSVGEGEGGMFRENSIEIYILSIVKQITSPGWMHETSAWAWCTGKTQRDHSSILAWEISWTEKAGGLQSMGLQKVGHD